ncbi:hypothetical protein E2C01_001844 [Portunus trituberculatus]|uniref:Uncharacterized protein n=1 Tax=Portunus trituberculatus TaxID=210409 RepID=A0A5B7CIC2_PORTR|nr:hypothetical protein [Portunus trituberculatus]
MARIRLLARVGAHVACQLGRTHEATPAQHLERDKAASLHNNQGTWRYSACKGELLLAVERLAGHQVAPHKVGLEVDGLCAAVAAQRTLVWPLACMGAEVARELGRTCKNSLTHMTSTIPPDGRQSGTALEAAHPQPTTTALTHLQGENRENMVGTSVGTLPRVGPQVDGQLRGGLAVLATEAAAVVVALVVGRNIVKGRKKMAGWRVTYECGDRMGFSWRRVAHVQAGHGLCHQSQGHASVAAECLQETKQATVSTATQQKSRIAHSHHEALSSKTPLVPQLPAAASPNTLVLRPRGAQHVRPLQG